MRILLVLSKVHNIHTKSIDITLAYAQADVKIPTYLHTPQGIDFGEGSDTIVLKSKSNLYGLKDTGLTWWDYLSNDLNKLGFQ